jgi:hypothetical protein
MSRIFLATSARKLFHSLLSVERKIVPSIYWPCYCTDGVRFPALLGIIIIIIIIIINLLFKGTYNIYLKQTIFVGYIVLQLFGVYAIWYM